MILNLEHIGYMVDLVSCKSNKGGSILATGVLKAIPDYSNNWKYVLNPGLMRKEMRTKKAMEIILKFHDDPRSTLYFEEIIHEKGSKLAINYSEVDYGNIYLDAIGNPKPDWLLEFENITNYDPEKIKIYLAGVRALEKLNTADPNSYYLRYSEDKNPYPVFKSYFKDNMHNPDFVLENILKAHVLSRGIENKIW